jgi:hypothetical protein
MVNTAGYLKTFGINRLENMKYFFNFWEKKGMEKLKHLTILISSLAAGTSIFWKRFSHQIDDIKLNSVERPAITAGERALAILEVQNTFSKHSYYHAAAKHVDELIDVWVKLNGPHAATAKWTSNSGIIEGMAQIKKFYGDNLTGYLKFLLASTSKIVPEIENIPENLGVGFGHEMNCLTTPIIEIAGDGETAKGIWYSPGINITGSVLEDGKTKILGEWRMTKYGVDFAKEDGKWKIWHIGVYFDNTPPGWSYENGKAVNKPAEAFSAGTHGAPLKGTEDGHPNSATAGISIKPNPSPYQAWSPVRAQKIEPRIPEPYYSFSETFSY